MNKERLISRWNWYQRIITYPAPNWDKETQMDFYFRFHEFVDTVKLCGYQFIHHSEKGMFDNKYLSVATDVVPLDR